MTTPTPTPAEGKDDRKRSLGKYVKRMSSVFKRDKSGKSSASSTPAATPATPASPSTPLPKVKGSREVTPAPIAPDAEAPAPAPASKETTTATAAAAAAAAATATTSPPPPTAPVHHINRNRLQQERARALFAKYGLTLESHEWIAPPSPSADAQRVEKPIRMRVHRSCHHCGTTYGADKVCSGCEHKRCKKCPRYPKKKLPAVKDKEAVEEEDDRHKKKKVLAIQKKGGEERVYQPVKQRVRRTCHKCSALFIPPTATVCESCRHIRCTKCPREPAKLHKWPHGYPGDADATSDTEVDALRELEMSRRVWRKPRTRVRWECEECHSQFLEGSPLCPGCGHERCEKCSRTPIRRVKKELQFSPEAVRSVEAKLHALTVEQQEKPPAVGAEAT